MSDHPETEYRHGLEGTADFFRRIDIDTGIVRRTDLEDLTEGGRVPRTTGRQIAEERVGQEESGLRPAAAKGYSRRIQSRASSLRASPWGFGLFS